MIPKLTLGPPHRAVVLVLACLSAGAARLAAAPTTIFQVTSFSNLQYQAGFTGTVGVTGVWPSEMGWQGERIDIGFNLAAAPPATARHYRFRVVITQRFVQAFSVNVLAGPSLADLVQVQSEFIGTARVLTATIPLDRFVVGQINWIRLQGVGVDVGPGEPSGIQWNRWRLTRTDTSFDQETAIDDQLTRLTNYVVDAIQPSGLVRDSLVLSPFNPSFHPATPDAGGFALLALCAADHLGLLTDAEARAEAVLSAYSGHTPGVTPTRNVPGHWWHWMNITTGAPEPGWSDNYTTIGSALLVSGALFAKNHFIENSAIGAYADEMFARTDFDAMIHPALDGRVSLVSDAAGDALGYLPPWNEYMLIVSLALRQPGATRAPVISWRWIDPATAPTRSYQGIPTLTDNVSAFAPAFWVQQQYFFNADFASNTGFDAYFHNHRLADELYVLFTLGQVYRFGLTAGVSPSGYTADRINAHQSVYSPEAVVGWGQLDTMMEFVQDQPPGGDNRTRYGLTRVSSANAAWIPADAGLVDHLFLMFGLVEARSPLFFKQRQAHQPDGDIDGLADAFDNCAAQWNPRQQDGDANGTGDACSCGSPFADADGDIDVDLMDYAAWQICAAGGAPDACLCMDRDADHAVAASDLVPWLACLSASGPNLPAPTNCGG